MRTLWNRGFAAVVLVTGLCFVSAPAWAATCGGLTTCACNDSVASSYTLTADLDCSGAGVKNADALRIVNRTGVVLDCNGFAITGGNVTGVNGVAVDGGSTDIEIKNCNVSEFDRGVSVKDSSDVKLSNLTAHHNLWYGVEVADTTTAPDTTLVSLETSYILNNGDEGVHFSGRAGVVPQHSIIGNVVSENNCEGIYIANLSGTLTPSRVFGVRVLGNSLFGNGIGGGPQSCGAGAPGILLNDSDVNRVRYNSLTHDNFSLIGSSDNVIGNQVINFGRVKFEDNSDDNELSRVCVQGDFTSPADSFVIDNSSGNSCSACTAIRPDTFHIVTTGTASGNTFPNLRIAPDLTLSSSGSGVSSYNISTGVLPCME